MTDEMSEAINQAVRLENRLTKMEAAIVANTNATDAAGMQTGELARHVKTQNGRVGKLENWKSQVMGVYGAVIVAAPFIFWALNRWAP